MSLKAFRQVSSSVPDVDVLARAVRDYTEPLTRNPLLDGQLIQGVNLVTSKEVPHNLGRPWIGYIITYSSTLATFKSTRKATDSQFIYLEANTPVMVDVWVF